MSYKIVVDSCCDITKDLKGLDNLAVVPLSLEIGDYHIFDDENFNQDDFIARIKASSTAAKSACPAPDAFKTAYEGDFDDVYVITITDKLSGTYNSALQGKMLYEEEFNDGKNIHVFNSLATSGVESILVTELKKVCDEGRPFDEVVAYIEDFIANHTGLYFCLDSLDALKSNGRLFALAASVLEKIHLKLVCKAKEGNISLSGKDITMNKALIKLANFIAKEVDGKDLNDKKLVVSHVCCEDRANFVAKKITEKVSFGDVEIIKASGLNTLYASDGGIIVSYSC